MNLRYTLFFGIFFFAIGVSAQLDTKHWVPPFYAKPGPNTGTNNIQKHFVSLSTPTTDTIPVTIKNGFGEVVAVVEISRNMPKEYTFGNGNANTNTFPLNTIPTDSLNLKIRSQGLYFESYQPFFVNIRHKSGSQGISLTTKGQVALGKRFYSGHPYTRYNTNVDFDKWNNERRSHFISVMATEDNTVVTFDMIKDPISFIGHPQGEPISVVLDAFESYVIGVDHSLYDDNTINNINGTRVQSNKPIVCSSGSWLSGNELGQDIGTDQLVPAEVTGQEYILIRGLGDESTERPMVVATEDNTEVYLNDETTPSAVLNESEFFIIPTEKFSANGNMYVLTTKKAYMYQTLSGSSTNIGQTIDLVFIPPLNCVGAKEVNLPFVNSLAAGNGQGRINIITKTGTSIYVNENPTPIGGALPVEGNPDWVTYAFDPPSNNVIIQSDSVMNVNLLTRDNVVGTAGYFSGFTLEPVVGLSAGISGTLPCIPGNAALQVFGFDAYQWYFNGEEIPGATDNSLYPEFAGNYIVEGIDIACGYRFPSNQFAIPYCPSTLGAAKNVQNIEETAPGSRVFDVTYRIFIENFSLSPSQNIQVMENINGGLPAGATAELIGTPSIVFGILTGGINPDFDGVAVRQLLPGTGSLPGSAVDAIDLTVRIDMNDAEQDGYFNQVVVTSKNGEANDGITGPFNGQDFSHHGTNPDPNGNGEPNEEGENDPTLTCFFSNAISYPELLACDSENEIMVEIEGVSSGVFTSDDGLAIVPETGTIDPSASTAGTYTVTFTVGGRCPTVTTTEITIVAKPDAGTPIAVTEACVVDETVNLNDYMEGATPGGVWTDADGALVASDIYNIGETGSFEFTYTIEVEPCAVVSNSFTLHVVPEPNPGLPIEDLSICLEEETTNLFDFIQGEQPDGQWSDSNGNDIPSIVALENPGIYTYTYTVANDACGKRSIDVEITVVDTPHAGTSVGDETYCAGEEIYLPELLIDPDLDGQWYDSNGNEVDDNVVISQVGSHNYTYTINRAPCAEASITVELDIIQGPAIGSVQNPNLICLGIQSFNLIDYIPGADGGGIWTDAFGSEVTGIFDPKFPGEYEFTYTLTSPECNDIAIDLVLDVSENHCDNTQIIIPQGFSPNGDGIGDRWEIVNIYSYPKNKLLVFNRWGEEVFSASPYLNDWDGKSTSGLNKDDGLPVGTYWYILDLGDGSEILKGYVYLNR